LEAHKLLVYLDSTLGTLLMICGPEHDGIHFL